MEGTVDGDGGHLRYCGKAPGEHQLPVGSLAAAPPVAHKDKRNGAIVFCGSPQDPWDDARLSLEVESAFRDTALFDRFANPCK